MKRKPIYMGVAYIFIAALLATSCEHSDQEVRVSNISDITVNPGTVAQGGTVELIVVTDAVVFTQLLESVTVTNIDCAVLTIILSELPPIDQLIVGYV